MSTQIIKDGVGYLDYFVSLLVLPTIDIWNAIGATPNTLTTFGLLTSILSIYYFHKNNARDSIIFLMLRCYFDYADGMLARKYNKVTKYGDIYDHFVDLLFGIMMFVLVFLKGNKDKYYLVLILGTFYFLFTVHMGCSQIEYSKSSDPNSKDKTTLSYLSKLCHKVNPETMKMFDNTVLYIIMGLIILKICKENSISKELPMKGIILISRM